MRLKIVALALVACAVVAAAQAQPSGQYRYRWLDAGGQAHYSDSLTNEAIKNGYDIIDANGIVIRHVERTLTAQERAAREKAAKKAAIERRNAQRRAQDDRQMLAAYPTVGDYKVAQQAIIDTIAQHIYTTKANLRSQEQNLAALLDKAADAERNGKKVPAYLTGRIAERRKAIADQRVLLQRQQQQKVAAENDLGAKLKHYRDLRAQQKALLGG